MTTAKRRTVVTFGAVAMRERRLAAARRREHGLQVCTIEQLAARLAGGLCHQVDEQTLRAEIQAALPDADLGELESIKTLPGFVDAATATLQKAWLADVDLQSRAAEHSRIKAIAALETAVLERLPPAAMRASELAKRALENAANAAALFGEIEILGITELSPTWRPLLQALAKHTPVRWNAGPRSVPEWLKGLSSGASGAVRGATKNTEPHHSIEISTTKPQVPAVTSVSAATTYHEAIEAVRWARRLLASGRAKPQEIAIASVHPSDYDDHLLAVRADANLDIHFAHGVKVPTCREGQAAGALADVLARGLSQIRIRRLAVLLAAYPGPFANLPEGWLRLLPRDAPLNSRATWSQLINRLDAHDWPDGKDHGKALQTIVDHLAQGVEAIKQRDTDAVREIGEALLTRRALRFWHEALLAGSPAALDRTLDDLRTDDGLDCCVSITWMPASALAAAPRPFVYLLGLNSSRWPQSISEDHLLGDHIIPTAELDPLPVNLADRRDFATIRATTTRELVLSRARRDSEGRLLGRSMLLHGIADESYLRRNRIPAHAFSETDRLTARRQDIQDLPQAKAADACWRDWQSEELTPHDGIVRPNHPVICAILERTQSANSLRRLLRNPIGFVWQYGLRWRAPETGEDPLVLDALATGNLTHRILEHALRITEAGVGLARAKDSEIAAAVEDAAREVAASWRAKQPMPPQIIWRRTLENVCGLCRTALRHKDESIRDPRAYAEVPFGGAKPETDDELPWDAAQAVAIPDTQFQIQGHIDRLDIAADGKSALVRDYKTGRTPKDTSDLDGGKELQRCFYAFAAKALLGEEVSVNASLLYLRDNEDQRLKNPEATLEEVTYYLQAARKNLLDGGGTIGKDAGDTYDDLAFALPANANPVYRERKRTAVGKRLGTAAEIWTVGQ